MRLPGATRASGCSTLCLCFCGNLRLLPNQPCGVCSKNNCTRLLLIGLGGLLPTKVSGRTMVEVFTIGNEENSAWPVDELNASPFTMPNNILWSLPPDHLSLGTSDVHVWAAHLDPPTEELVRFAASLSRDEQE